MEPNSEAHDAAVHVSSIGISLRRAVEEEWQEWVHTAGRGSSPAACIRVTASKPVSQTLFLCEASLEIKFLLFNICAFKV